MKSREWHLDCIAKLKFERKRIIDEHNRSITTSIAILSVTTAMLLFEFSQQQKRIIWLTFLVIGFAVLMWAINREPNTRKYDSKIQKNYEALINREK